MLLAAYFVFMYLSVVAEYQGVFVLVVVDDDEVVFVDFLCQNVFRQLVEHKPVYGTLHGAGAELRVEAFVGKERQGCGGDLQLDAA